MENLWSDADARSVVEAHAARGIGEDLALRVYTTRLLGGEPRLVLHGGGNTSVKTAAVDILGDEVEVLHVKGSGWDMGTIEAPGLPAVRLAPLRAMRRLTALSDEDMVNGLRGALLDSRSPNPSVETLLHAFLPHKFIDHTHSVAVLSLIDQPNADELMDEVYGARAVSVPYVIPGFALAKLAGEAFDAHPDVEALILEKHGIFTFGDTARDAYERMIEFVSRAEDRLFKNRRDVFAAAAIPAETRPADALAPSIRGALSACDPAGRRWVMEFRTSPGIRNFVDGADLARYAGAGVATPDHVIRTKPKPLILPPCAAADDLSAFSQAANAAARAFAADYDAYFERHNARWSGAKTKLDPVPRIVLVPGAGLFGVGKSAKDARIAADVYEAAIQTITDAEAIGRFESICEEDLFDIEYWSLEQAKLGKAAEPPLGRQVAVITGAAGAIGRAAAEAFAAAGAAVALLDLDGAAAEAAAAEIGPDALGLACDVTNAEDTARAFAAVRRRFGGLDILVSNAGAAWSGRMGEVSDADLRASFELNFFAHQRVAAEAVSVMLAQGTGGCLLFNTSKQAINPGPSFGAYGAPKAATLFLSRQYALDYGAYGIRANAVNADRIRSGLLSDEMIAKRAAARGVSEADYMAGNLLGVEVEAQDVAKAFVDLALSPKTTGCVLTVDGGNIAAALR